MRRGFLGLLAAAALVTLPAQADDQHDLEAARALANAGRELFEKGDYTKALQRFETAESIFHAPPHLLFIARTKQKLGKLFAARETYQKLVAEKLTDKSPEAFHRAHDTAAEELAALEAHIPKLVFKLVGPDHAHVSVDGATVDAAKPLPVEPGPHDISAQAEGASGFAPMALRITVKDGETTHPVELKFASTFSTTPSARDDGGPKKSAPIGPIALLAGGGAVLIAGAALGGVAIGKMNQLKLACLDRHPCPPDNGAAALKEQVKTFANASTALFVIGGVAAAAGGTWLTLDMLGIIGKPARDAWLTVRPIFGLGSAGLTGTF